MQINSIAPNPVASNLKTQTAIDSGLIKPFTPEIPIEQNPVKMAIVERQQVQTNRLPSIESTIKPIIASTANPIVAENAARIAVSTNVIPSTTVSISDLATTFAANPPVDEPPTPMMQSATAVANAYKG